MIFFTKLLFGALRGIDPLAFLAPICLGLSACFMALLVQLERVTARWRDDAMKRRAQALPSPVVSDPRRRDHRN